MMASKECQPTNFISQTSNYHIWPLPLSLSWVQELHLLGNKPCRICKKHCHLLKNIAIARMRVFQSRATRLYIPLCRAARPSIGLSVCRSHFTSFMFLDFCPHCSCPNAQIRPLKYDPCPPARNWGSRVFGLVLLSCHKSVYE